MMPSTERLYKLLTKSGCAQHPDWEYPVDQKGSVQIEGAAECTRFNFKRGQKKYYVQLTRRTCLLDTSSPNGEIQKYTLTNFDPESPNVGRTYQFDERDVVSAYEVSRIYNVNYADANALVYLIERLGVRVAYAETQEYGVQA